jgi:hypothetical protein
MPIGNDMELSDEQKRAVEQAHLRFAQGMNPLLYQQFFADGFPTTLCHYTDFGGLQGILQSGALWATYSQTLNDGSEQEYGLQTVNRYIERLPNSREMNTFRASMTLPAPRNFVCCFCEESDLLSMWIAYSQRGGGFCLEFEGATGLLKCSFPPFATRMPFKMTYGDQIPDSIEAMLRYTCEFAQSGDVEATVGAVWLKLLSLMFKHPAFKHENERRIVIPGPPVSAMKFRAGAFDVKPYIEMFPTFENGTRRLPLRRVLVGPTLRQGSILIESVQLMLERYGFSDIPVVPCGIPYRL